MADAIIDQVGNNVVLALPLGLGKANHIANALTERALKDSSITLEIITALTLETPALGDPFTRRLLEPALERLFGNSPPLRYAQLLRDDALPDNIRISEFFLQAGQWLSVTTAQQNFIPANYTHALRYLLDRGVNVIAQLLASNDEDEQFSLSCNPDITADLLQLRRDGQCQFLFAGQLNSELPFMTGAARVEATEVDLLLQGEANEFPLFSIPKRPVSLADHAIGLHAARLVRDGGTLQIGIGAIGDAVCHALLLRQRDSGRFAQLQAALNRPSKTGLEETGSFETGLYGLSEMFVDGFLHLAENGVLKREVDGAVLDGGFFVDCKDFYRRLREMPAEQRDRFRMMPVSFINELYDNGQTGGEHSKRQARVKAVFINSAMMATLRGAVISDALEDGRVISGVGGQYNFGAQAFALQDARFIITLNATRRHHNQIVSNIVWSYGHTTLPWHLRDIIITEYGVADLRGKTENEAVKAMLQIADSRFQPQLLKQALAAGKLESGWQIPAPYNNNTPQALADTLAVAGNADILPDYPFGTDFTAIEQRLLPALEEISQRAHSRRALAALAWQGLWSAQLSKVEKDCMARMQLDAPRGRAAILQSLLLKGALGCSS